MVDKTPKQLHDEKVQAVQAALQMILDIATQQNIPNNKGKLQGKGPNKLVVLIEIGPAQFGENVLCTKVTDRVRIWKIEFGEQTKSVIDSVQFNDTGHQAGGRIHFDRPSINCIEEANNLTALIEQVTDWKIVK